MPGTIPAATTLTPCLVCEEYNADVPASIDLGPQLVIGRAHDACIKEQQRMHALVPELVAKVTRLHNEGSNA